MRNLTRAEATERAAVLQVLGYDVELDLTAGDTHYLSTTTVRLRARAATFLELDAELLEATARDDAGQELPVRREGNRLLLTGAPGEQQVRVVARGAYTRTGEGLHRFLDPADGEAYVWGQSFLDHAQQVIACADQPDLKAPVALRVRAPAGWTVIGNAVGTQTAPGQWSFAPTPPIPPYLFHVSAGPWHGVRRAHEGLELGLWSRRSLAPVLEAAAEELFAVTTQCLAFQQELFGRAYPFGPSYDQLFVPEFNHGAMENPGAVTFTEDFLPRGRTTLAARRKRAMVVAHEMAHMWFGDLVTMRWWDGLWLNESFAELLGYWTVDAATGFPGGWVDFCTSRKAWGYRADAAPTTHPIAGTTPDTRSALLDFDGISYAKGASVLRQLAAVLGPEVFFGGVRRYLAAHAWGSTDLADLLQALEAESGRDLQDWARAWLQTTGTSLLRPEGTDVVQVGVRPHRLGVALYRPQDGRLVRAEARTLELSGERTATGLPAAGPGELLLLNDGDLAFVRTRLDPHSLATAVASLDRLDDDLARALVTASLWDALREGELPARTLLLAWDGALAAERDPVVLATLVGQARTAAALYRDPAARPAALGALADRLGALVGSAEAGSDLQLERVRGWARTTDDAPALRALLDTGAVPDGLEVDEDLRWLLRGRLAALGALDRAQLDAALAADRTATGELAHARACAARPEPHAKQQAWDEVLAGGASNARAAALAEGFWQVGQDALLEPYAARYVAELATAARTLPEQIARTVARALFPATLPTAPVLGLVEQLLESELPVGLRRIVREQQDDLRRAARGATLDAAADAVPA